jgi:hypothetical protein
MNTTRADRARRSPVVLAVTAASGVVVLAAIASCSGNSSDASEQSGTLSSTSTNSPSATTAAPWQCPATPDNDQWPVSTHTSAEVMVPPTPNTAIECTYQQPPNQPATLFGPPVTYTGTELTDLITPFNTGTEPNHAMSCPPPSDGAPV